jgi:hypothetical protein
MMLEPLSFQALPGPHLAPGIGIRETRGLFPCQRKHRSSKSPPGAPPVSRSSGTALLALPRLAKSISRVLMPPPSPRPAGRRLSCRTTDRRTTPEAGCQKWPELARRPRSGRCSTPVGRDELRALASMCACAALAATADFCGSCSSGVSRLGRSTASAFGGCLRTESRSQAVGRCRSRLWRGKPAFDFDGWMLNVTRSCLGKRKD